MPTGAGFISDEEVAELDAQSPQAQGTGAAEQNSGFISDDEVTQIDAQEQLNSVVKGGARRVGEIATDDIPGIATAGAQWWQAAPQWAGGGSDEWIPRRAFNLASSVASAEGNRIKTSAQRAIAGLSSGGDILESVEKEPGEVLGGVAGMIPLFGSSAENAVDAAGSGDPERMGHAAVDVGLNLLPFERFATAGRGLLARRALKKFANTEGRIKNVSNITGAAPQDVPFIRKSIDEIDDVLPMGGRRVQETASELRRARTGTEVGRTRGELQGRFQKQDLLDDIDPHVRTREEIIPEHVERELGTLLDPSGQRHMIETTVPEKTVIREMTGDPQRARATAQRKQAIVDQYGNEIELGEGALRKGDAGDVADRGKLYDQTPGGPAIGVDAVAAGDEANALKRAIEKAAGEGDSSAQAYLKASDESSVAIGLDEPLQARRNAMLSAGRGVSHGVELGGRAVAGARLAGGTSAAGALVGMQAVKVWNSPLWNSLSLRAKRHVIDALETGGFDAMRDAMAIAMVAQANRSREAQKILEKKGEGVIGP